MVLTEQSDRIDCKSIEASTQSYNNGPEAVDSVSSPVERVNAESQTINEQSASTSAAVDHSQAFGAVPEPMDTDVNPRFLTDLDSAGSRSSTASTSSALNPPDMLSTFIANISDELGSFNEFMQKSKFFQ